VKKLRPGQIPDWRPGALYWKPLADGREITIYPLTYGKARLCVGPLADPKGYDTAYRYASADAAVNAAEEWDPDEAEQPPGFEAIDFGAKNHKPKKLLIHSEGIQPGSKMELNDTTKAHFSIEEVREVGDEKRTYLMEGWTEDDAFVHIEAVRYTGDPVGNNGDPLVTVTKVNVQRGGHT
jgi:hypothetical protein